MALSNFEWNRRRFLGAGASGILGLSLPQLLAMKSATAATNQSATKKSAPNRAARAKNVLVIYEQGGLSHIDTWDPKPDVATEHRSPYKPISTNVPGMQFTELLSKTARLANKLTVVRSMHHAPGRVANGHPDGTQYSLSGSHPGSPIEMPDIGSIATHLMGSDCKYLPPYIMVPGNHEQAAMTRNGFLPASTKVFKTQGGDLSRSDWKVGEITPRPDARDERLAGRQHLLASLDRQYLGDGTSGNSSNGVSSDSKSGALDPLGGNRGGLNLGGMDRFYEQAFDMLTSSKVAAAFDYQGEPDSIREKYGSGHRGACYLVGRKLIEAGVRFVTVDVRWPLTKETPGGGNLNWDHHDFIYTSGTCNLPGASGAGAGRYGIGHWCMMGSVDQAFSALLEDLEERGLLADTLVCFVTEFGRTPKVNKFQGRDHWTNAYSIAFAGAGVPGGQVIGASDRDGGFVTTEPYTPENYASTIYEKLGIDRSKPLYTAGNRPVFFGHAGEPIPGLF